MRRMILDSKLSFKKPCKGAIIKARKGIGIILFLSKYVLRNVLGQIYKLYVRLHLDFGDIIYHRYDPEFKLEFTKRLESTQNSAALDVLVVHGDELTLISCTKNSAGKFFITEGGIDVSATL